MKKMLSCATLLVALTLNTYAQKDDHIANSDKKVDHVIGVQANELLKQMFSLGSSAEVNNPFLLKYGLRFNQANTEISLGTGLTTSSSNDPERKTNNTDLFLRLGFAKYFYLGKRWELSAGLDGVTVQTNNSSESTRVNEQPGFKDSTFTRTVSKTSSFGGGPQLTFNFYISKNIKVGTEMTAYFLYAEDSFEDKFDRYTESGGNVQFTSNEDSGTTYNSGFDITVPIAIFLMVKF